MEKELSCKQAYKSSTESDEQRELKVTIIGDSGVGKTSLILTKIKKRFPGDYYPRSDGFESDLKLILDRIAYRIIIYDYPGQDDYDELRRFSLSNTDCVLLCYSVSNKTSYKNIIKRWMPELRECCLKIPIILIATKCDLRVQSEKILTQSHGEKLKNKLPDIYKYMECSALLMKGLDEIFIEAINCLIENSKETSKSCEVQ